MKFKVIGNCEPAVTVLKHSVSLIKTNDPRLWRVLVTFTLDYLSTSSPAQGNNWGFKPGHSEIVFQPRLGSFGAA